MDDDTRPLTGAEQYALVAGEYPIPIEAFSKPARDVRRLKRYKDLRRADERDAQERVYELARIAMGVEGLRQADDLAELARIGADLPVDADPSA